MNLTTVKEIYRNRDKYLDQESRSRRLGTQRA